MRINRKIAAAICYIIVVTLIAGFPFANASATQKASGAVEAAIKKEFFAYWEDLRSREFEAAYSKLATVLNRKLSIVEYTRMMEAFDATYTSESVKVKEVFRNGNIAVLETLWEGQHINPSFPKPVRARIEGQTVMVLEKGKWRIATGNQENRRRYVDENPELLDHFRFHDDILYFFVQDEWKTADELIKAYNEKQGASKDKAPSNTDKQPSTDNSKTKE